MLKDYMFIDNKNGEIFLVETISLNEAWEIVYDQYAKNDIDYVVNNIEYIRTLSVEMGEILGYDTY